MTDTIIQFSFLNKTYSAEVVPSFSEKPFYFFILFNENEIIREFGEELCIATIDGNSITNNNIATNTKVKNLKEVIFREIQKVPEYSTKLRH
jgi:hypothetical protein